MSAELTHDISDFQRRDITLDGKTKPVLVSGEAGQAVREPRREAVDEVIACLHNCLAA